MPDTYVSDPSSSASSFALLNARLIDPVRSTEISGGVLINKGRIEDIGPHLSLQNVSQDYDCIDMQGAIVAPGLVDMRVFIGEPGGEYRETFKTAGEAAGAGGVTTCVQMPDTHPSLDHPAIVDFVRRRARDTALTTILPAAAITRGSLGAEITEMGLLREAGAALFTDGQKSIVNPLVMRRAMTYARDFDALIMHHVQDPFLEASGVMNEGERSMRLGLSGIPKEAETIMLERDIRLVRLTGVRYHAAMISCADSIAIIRRAKEDGLQVTCGVSINNLTLNENDIGDYRTFLRLSPPLRSEEERQALIAALAEGIIDVIVSDHNPQDVETKRLPFAEAANGAVGLETLLSAAFRLVLSGSLDLPTLFARLSFQPATLLGLACGRLERGAPADLIVFDPDAAYVLDKSRLYSRAKNSPFDEARMEGRVLATFVQGRQVYSYKS